VLFNEAVGIMTNDDMMINAYGAVGGIRIGKGN
jgi:hypothetical protein